MRTGEIFETSPNILIKILPATLFLRLLRLVILRLNVKCPENKFT